MAGLRRAIFSSVILGCLLLAVLGFVPRASARDSDSVNVVQTEKAHPAFLDIQKNSLPEHISCEWAEKYPETVVHWCDLIEETSVQYQVDKTLIAALMVEESGGDPLAYSRDGAVGLLQVMPRDGIANRFDCLNGPCFATRPTIGELQDPKFNLTYGVGYLSSLIRTYGSQREALKYYGPVGVGYLYADAVLSIQSQFR